MYAILRQGNHQYRVAPGDIIQVEKLDVDKGDRIELDEVLALNDGQSTEVGSPCVADAHVTARVLRNGRGKKVIVYKFKRRKGYSKKQGHRQDFTEIQILGLHKSGQELKAPAAAE